MSIFSVQILGWFNSNTTLQREKKGASARECWTKFVIGFKIRSEVEFKMNLPGMSCEMENKTS
jgi:hypothetical protein